MTDMPIEEAQLMETARDLIQNYKVHQSDFSQLIDNFAEALIYKADIDLGKATEVVRVIWEQEKCPIKSPDGNQYLKKGGPVCSDSKVRKHAEQLYETYRELFEKDKAKGTGIILMDFC